MNKIVQSKVPINFDVIPDYLKVCQQWVVWSLVKRKDKKTGREKLVKIPYDFLSGCPCDITDPSNYQTFDTVSWLLKKYPNSYSGIGFCLKKENGITGIDLDNAFDEEGELKAWAAEILAVLPPGTYIEKSPSGHGLRAFLGGILPPGRRRQRLPNGESIEIYDSARFLTMTGNRYGVRK